MELAEHYLRRSESVPGAYVKLTPSSPSRQARAADEAVAQGRAEASCSGSCPVKDLFFMAGANARMGSAAFDPSYADDNVVQAMRAAGLVFTGKTNTPEFGLPCYTEPDPEVAPPARCVWDERRTAGGSSGGAAVAVAAGLAPIAHGSDGGGSVRIPCVGQQPGRDKALPRAHQQRPAARSRRGPGQQWPARADRGRRCRAAGRDVGPFPGDPYFAPPPSTSFLTAARTPCVVYASGSSPTRSSPTFRWTAERPPPSAGGGAVDLGHTVEPTPRPFGPEMMSQFEVLWHVLALLTPVAPDDEPRLQPLTRHLPGSGTRCVGDRAGDRGLHAADPDPGGPGAVGGLRRHPDPDGERSRAAGRGHPRPRGPRRDFELQKKWAAWTAAFNMTGQPAINLPLHWTDAGLPVECSS